MINEFFVESFLLMVQHLLELPLGFLIGLASIGLIIAAVEYFDYYLARQKDKRKNGGRAKRPSNNDVVPGFDKEMVDTLAIHLEKFEEIPGCLIFYLSGYVKELDPRHFLKCADMTIKAGFHRLIFNCKRFLLVSDDSIHIFTAFARDIKRMGGDIALVELHPKDDESLRLLGFAGFFNIRDSLEEAIVFFKKGGGEEAIFPITFKCPICRDELKASKSGQFRWSECKIILQIDEKGQVFLG